MLNLPQETLLKIKKVLLRKQKYVEKRIKSLDKENPVLNQGVAESSEPGTDSWLAEVHGRLTSVKNDMMGLSDRITHALSRLKRGTYGKCECCGKMIEPERLKVMPTATLCIACSKAQKCPQKPAKK